MDGWRKSKFIVSYEVMDLLTADAQSRQFALLLQIIEKNVGSINYDNIELPEGRTKKACVIMIDKEKRKMREAAVAANPGASTGSIVESAEASNKVCRLLLRRSV